MNSIGMLIQAIWKLDLTKAYRVNIVAWRERRSLNQNDFQHVIYTEISKFLISKGRTDWTVKVVKKNMKNKFLGWAKEEFIDVVTGEITTKDILVETSKLDVGDSYNYTTNLLSWCADMGIFIKIPSQCDYRDIMDSQIQ